MEAYEETGGNVIAVEEVDRTRTSRPTASSRAARAPTAASPSPAWWKSPSREDAPSNLFISGRYILQPEIFTLLAEQPRGAGGEIQITDAMQTLMRQQTFTGVKYEGQVFDCGSKIGFLTANVVFALDRADIRGRLHRRAAEARIWRMA